MLSLLPPSLAFAYLKVYVEGVPAFLQGAVCRVLRRVAEEVEGNPLREAIIRKITPKLFPGYGVGEVSFKNGFLKVKLVPACRLVERVSVSFSPAKYPSLLKPLFDSHLRKIRKFSADLFKGLPVEALDWAQEVASLEIRDLVSRELPGYDAHISLFLLPKGLMLKISLRGKEPLILNMDLVLRSRTVPNLILRGLRKEFLPSVKLMEGLPVAFVRKNESYFKNLIIKEASMSKALSFYRLDVSPKLRLGRLSSMIINLESRTWSISAEGTVYVGLRDSEPEGKVHFGKIFKEGELFWELKALLESVELEHFLGLKFRVGPELWLGVKRSLSDGDDFFFVHYANLRFGYWDADGGVELSYAYWFGSWVRVEFTYSTHEEKSLFLRVVGRL